MDKTYLCLCGLLWASLIQADCPYQECQCASSWIMCMNLGLTSMPALNATVKGFTSLSLDGCQITSISAGSLPTNLVEISLIDNPITTIDDTAFDGSKCTLRRFTISNARFVKIPGALSQLQNLQEFHLIGVHVTDWNIAAMRNIGSTLNILYLEHVDLSTSPDWLQYFSRLTELSILSSSLTKLPDNAMSLINSTLTQLTLYNNSLTEVPKAMSVMKSLITVYLNNNKIANTTWLPASSKLQLLSLEDNRIYDAAQLSSSLRPYADSLAYFDIDDNQLSSLPDLSFLTQVKSLSFENNKLSDPNSGSMPQNLFSLDLQNNFLPRIPQVMSSLHSITELALFSNYITTIQSTDFPPSVTSVELGFNHITELSDNSFPENSTINYLYLNNNPISKISPTAFNNLPQLSVLNMQETQLARMPLALSSLTSLFMLYVTNTPTLVCTCLEKSLETWIVTLGPEGVDGNCGEMTIYAFFKTLSPGCPSD